MTRETKVNFLINAVFYSVVAIILFFSVKFLFVYLLPFIIGTLVTVLVQRPSTFISKRINIKKGYCALLFVIIIYLVIIAVVAFTILKVGEYVSELATQNSGLISQLTDTLNNASLQLKTITDRIPTVVGEQISKIMSSIVSSITVYISDFAKSVAKSAPMFLTTSIVTIIASCYIAKDFDRFVCSVNSVTSPRYRRAFFELRMLFRDNMLKLLVGYMKLLLITFIELLIGLILLGVENALAIALVTSLLDLMPILGTGTVLIPWGVYRFISKDFFLGAGLLILYAIITLIRSIIEPKIIGKQIGLHPLIALISVFIGLKLFGVIGIFFMPLSVMIIYKMYDRGIFDILLQK